MSDYNAYGEMYDQRPELIIHERLRHLGTVKELVELAQQNNFKIDFERGPLRRDLLIKWHDGSGAKDDSHSLMSGLRYMKQITDQS